MVLYLAAPAVDDDKNGYGLRLRATGSVEVWDLGDHEVRPPCSSATVDPPEQQLTHPPMAPESEWFDWNYNLYKVLCK